MIPQGLWRTHYQVLPIIFLTQFIELNVNLNAIIQNVKRGIKYKYCDCFLEYANFKDDLVEYKCLCFNKKYQHIYDKNLKKPFFKK